MRALFKLVMIALVLALCFQYVKKEQPQLLHDAKESFQMLSEGSQRVVEMAQDGVDSISDTASEPKNKIKVDTLNEVTRLKSEYGVDWIVSHNHYKDFTLKLADDSGGYIAGKGRSILNVTIGKTTKDAVKKQYGEPLDGIRHGLTMYQFSKDDQQEQLVYEKDGYYLWFFIDRHNNNRVRAVQYVTVKTEQRMKNYYATANKELRLSYEQLMVLLMNQSRVEAGLKPLLYDKGLKGATRAHSQDMIDEGYFSHTGSDGSQPKDRMVAAGYTMEKLYAENLAYGQISSIFAHEGLMNSLGHRENILREEATNVGVGVAFDNKNVPYYTINFYTPM